VKLVKFQSNNRIHFFKDEKTEEIKNTKDNTVAIARPVFSIKTGDIKESDRIQYGSDYS
jgi:hypothetical protein